jgi:possible P-loop ATPase
MNQYGMTDVPAAIKGKDIFSVKSYINGLEEFILNCPTPMSIALQGDWGTGKTTFLKTIEEDFKEKNDKIKTIYFNTWAYSQFNNCDGLYFSLISNIINQLDVKDEIIKKDADDLLKKIYNILIFCAKSFFGKKMFDFTGADPKKIEAILNGQVQEVEEHSKAIQSLKETFAALVNKIVNSINRNNVGNKARIVICIDDLDRLEPKRAVEVLEVLKLFMDVENCVYLLAIDQNVVVSGVRSKYDSQMPEEKCRAFFDKIVQLPFSMPVQSYKVKELIEDMFGKDFLGNYKNTIYKFVQTNLGSNPRTIKRVLNRFCLLYTILESNNRKIQEKYRKEYCSLLILIITIQMHNEKAYDSLLNTFNNDNDAVEEWLEEKKWLQDNSEEAEKNALTNLRDSYDEIRSKFKDRNKELIEIFSDVLNLSVVTSTGEKKEYLFYVSIGDYENNVNKHSKSMLYLVEKLLSGIKGDKIVEMIDKEETLNNWMKFNSEKGQTYFRTLLKTEIKNMQGQNLYIGVSSGSDSKSRQVKYLIDILKKYSHIEEDMKITWTKYVNGEGINLLS